MKHAVTLKDLARELNISTSTVSRALRDNPEISASTRARVQKLAKELNYEPNALALSLGIVKTNTIGVILPKLVHFSFLRLLAALKTLLTPMAIILLYVNPMNELTVKYSIVKHCSITE